MSLYTDLIDPAELTSYMRTAIEAIERSKPSLSAYLPNTTVDNTEVKFYREVNGIPTTAKFRAFDAPPEMGAKHSGQKVTYELAPISHEVLVSEYEQIRLRGTSNTDQTLLNELYKTAQDATYPISDLIEYHRGQVLLTGKFVVNQNNFAINDDFGRDASLTIPVATASSPFSTDPLNYLLTLQEQYEDLNNGTTVGSWVFTRKVISALMKSPEFALALANGSSRSASQADVQSIFADKGLAPFTLYNRRVGFNGAVTPVIPDGYALALPAQANGISGNELGATIWGRTLTSGNSEYGLSDEQAPGLVAGVYQNDKPPMGLEIIADAIVAPLLANPNLSLSVQLVA